MAEGVKLATAYVEIKPDVSAVESGVKKALSGFGKHGDTAGRDMGSRMSTALSNSLGKSGTTAAAQFHQGLIAGIRSGSSSVAGEFGKLGQIAEGAIGGVSSKAGIAALGVAGIGLAAVAAGKQLYDLGAQWDDIADGITGKTGLVGKELDKITESVKNVGRDSSASLAEIGDATGSLVQSLRLSGKPLEDLTRNITDLNELTGDKLNIRDLSKVLKGFNIDADDVDDTLDRLYDTFTNTGIPVSELIQTLKSVGPTARTLGLDIGQVSGVLATLEEAGVDGSTALNGLRIGIGNLAKREPGKDPLQAIQGVVTEIQSLIDKGNETAAIDLSKSTFGKSWQPIFDAIANGKLTVDDLNTAIANTGHTIEGSKQATDDWAEEFDKLKNKLEIGLEPAASRVFGSINSLLSDSSTKAGVMRGTLETVAHTTLPGLSTAIDGLLGKGNVWDVLFSLSSPGGAALKWFMDRFGGGGTSSTSPGEPGVPPSFGPNGVGAPGRIQGPGIPQVPGGPGSSSGNPLDIFAPSGGGHPGPPQTGGGGNAAPAGLSGNQGAVYNAMIQSGYPASEWGALQNLLNGESGFRNTAQNPSSTAYGMFQFLDSTWAPYGAKTSDPATQAKYGLQYIKDRYGSPSAAWAFWQNQSPHWYDNGGWLQPGSTMAVNATGKPELILTPEQIQALLNQGIDPNTVLHGQGQGAKPGPTPEQLQQAQAPDAAGSGRTEGYIPAAAGSTGVAGTSMASSFLNLGSEAVQGAIQMGADLAKMAISAAATAGAGAGSFGGAAAAGPAAGAAAGIGIDIGSAIAKRGVSYGFQMAGIGIDALVEQLFPFGAPRWLGYDYTGFMPQLSITPTATTTAEKAFEAAAAQGQGTTDALHQGAGAPPGPAPHPGTGAPPGPGQPGGPVQPGQMPGGPQQPPQQGPAAPGTLPPPGQAYAPNKPPTAPFAGAPPGASPFQGPQAPPAAPPSQGLDLQNLYKNMFGFDSGGMLPPSSVGVNFTKRPEPVFTDAQWSTVEKLSTSEGGGNFGVRIENLYATDADDVKRQIDSQQKLAMMRYSGRP